MPAIPGVLNRGVLMWGIDALPASSEMLVVDADGNISSQAIPEGGAGAWGEITGTLSDQTDLQSALDAKAASVHTHAASAIVSGTVATARLGSGTADGTTYLRGDQTWQTITAGVTDHGALTGLADDDHTQYHTDARGDARYSQLGHTHAFTDITSTPTTLAGYGITDAQSLDATLTALAGVATAANKLIYATGSDTFATADFSSFGRSLVDDADAATARSTLGLGTMATEAAASYLPLAGGTLTGPLGGTSAVFSSAVICADLTANDVITSQNLGGTVCQMGAKYTGNFSFLLDSLLVFNISSLKDFRIPSDHKFGWASLANNLAATDTAISRAAAGIAEVNTGTDGVFGDLRLQNLSATGSIVNWGTSSTSTLRAQGEFVGSWVSSTDASRKAQVEEKVYDTAARTVARSFANGSNGYKALKVLATAPADSDLASGEVVFYTDGSGNLAIKLKDSGGTVRTGTVTLT